MSGTACRYCQQPVDDNWPVVMFRGEVARWCPSLRDVILDATTVAHAYCFAEQEGTDALSQLMPPAPGREECGAGELADGSRWRLLLHKLHTEVAGDVDLEFTLWFDPDAIGRGGGGPGWSAKSHEAPPGIEAMRQLGHNSTHVTPGKVVKDALLLAHLDDGATAPVTVVEMPDLPFDIFIASAPWPRWVVSIEARDQGGNEIGRTREFKPSEQFQQYRQRKPQRHP